ncbi:MAG TPA: cupin domain-containing protein, partial [Streptomyces sp.]|uniref:cupin domain-containing protein n=1 Tax=Streptomyces sp. TaxID=1931 RepID=UPI002C28EC7C
RSPASGPADVGHLRPVHDLDPVAVPGGAEGDLVRVHPGEEWLYVLDGRLRVVLGETVHDLDPGDSAHFDSLTPHRIAALDAAGARLLFVHTLLQSPAAELCLGGGTHRF